MLCAAICNRSSEYEQVMHITVEKCLQHVNRIVFAVAFFSCLLLNQFLSNVDIAVIFGSVWQDKTGSPPHCLNDKQEVQHINLKSKTILLWTTYHGTADWYNAQKYSVTSNLDYGNCLITTNRSSLPRADAVVLHGWDIDYDYLPGRLSNSSRMIYYSLEAPNRGKKVNWTRVNEVGFDWVMSYTRKADVYFPYGSHVRHEEGFNRTKVKVKIASFVKSFKQRPKDAIWLVSNCRTTSKREKIVASLRKYGLSIDIWGACTRRKPYEEWKHKDGMADFFSRYRFYLSFENSLCEDYVTEKFYRGLNASQHFGLIPIVYGGANYSTFAPKGSYINLHLFTNLEHLARFLKKLSHSDGEELKEYYNWQYDYKIPIQWNHHENGWRNLCKKLWQCNISSSSKQQVAAKYIRNRFGRCLSPRY